MQRRRIDTERLEVAGDTIFDVTLTGGTILTGKVTHEGKPYAGVEVRVAGVRGAVATTDTNGNYSILTPSGVHVMTLATPSGKLANIGLASQTNVNVAASGSATQDIAITLATTGTTVVKGNVFDADGTTPLGGVEITARDNTTGEVRGRAISNPAGIYIVVIH